uniref:Uncharacterized protein n=1 Tax=Kryptolebias marmoratus TaxID=37003 RepID=A0A3Q3EDL3_KRYMA
MPRRKDISNDLRETIVVAYHGKHLKQLLKFMIVQLEKDGTSMVCRGTNKQNMAGQKRAFFQMHEKLHLKKRLQDFWKNVFWTDETKVKLFTQNAQHHVWRKPNTADQHKHLIPAVSTEVEDQRIVEVMKEQNNDSKHSSRSTTERLKKKRVKVLQRSSQSPHLDLLAVVRH